MEKTKEPVAKKERPVTTPDHTEKIRTQVLAKTGRPPRLERVEVAKLYNSNYRVNLWETPEPVETISIAISARIRSSYYLKVSDTGEILHSNPPLARLQ